MSYTWPLYTFLGHLPAPIAEQATRLGSPCRFTTQEYLLREGERSDDVFLLLRGIIKVIGRSDDRDVLISLRVGGDVVGDLAALSGQQRIATVMACHDVETRRLSAMTWRSLLRDQPEAQAAYTRMLGDRLCAATRRQVDLAGCRPLVRVARILAELGQLYGRRTPLGLEIDVALTQPELAAAAACSESTLRTILRELREARILSTEYRRLVILDPAELNRLADTDT
ncbi:Crp/Fnr family transcriptional regulator [Frankia sp. CiP3]|uniref:Crp/Fnr family transcriptional regulator n=1 Tax=Frankia sp. CiP3 TaxID=2880971 RepID=UPI001EF5523F|nr:Crp/Fnr family transcriptional regulator [Frankia sp. CiP3]